MWQKIWIGIKGAAALIVLALLIGPQWPAFGDENYQIETIIGGGVFDFPTWIAETWGSKIAADLTDSHAYLSPEARDLLVRGYLGQLGQVLQWERELQILLATNDLTTPTLIELQERITAQRNSLAEIQPLVESILQDQVADVLLDEGFGIGGRVWPPVRMRLTPLPTLLVISPRDQIRQEHAIPLTAGLLAAERERLESAVLSDLDSAAFVTDIGGLGVYPTMVVETTNLNFLVEVIAHEWSHNWFNQYPLGLNYAVNGEIRTINESAASLIGEEIGRQVMERYYPDLLPPPAAAEVASVNPDAQSPIPPAPPPVFDFRIEMRDTRIRVDELLAAGQIEAAEAYMEARRKEFVENGFNLRVLNQAYFAFHGAYADQPGAAGADPIGPRVLEFRASSPSLRQFMLDLRFVTSLADLDELLEDQRQETGD